MNMEILLQEAYVHRLRSVGPTRTQGQTALNHDLAQLRAWKPKPLGARVKIMCCTFGGGPVHV